MANTYLSTDRLLKNEIDTKRSLTDNGFTQIGFVLNDDTSVRLRSIVQGVLNIDNPLGPTNTDATIEVNSTSVAKSILSNDGGGNDLYLNASGATGEETVSIRDAVDDTLRDLTARAISVENTITSPTVIVAPTIEGNGVSLVQFGITGDEFLDILPAPGQAGENRGIRCLYTLFRDFPGTENDKKLYYDSALSTRLLVDNQANQIAYVSDITNNFTGAVTITDGTTTTTLEQNTAGVNYDATGLVVSDNLLVNGLLYIGNGGGTIIGSVSSDSFTFNVNTPNNPNGFQDCQVNSIVLTDPATSANNIYLGYQNSTRLSASSTGNATLLGTIAYTSDIYGINYSASAYTGTTWTTNYSGAITTAWSNKQIVQIDPASNNEQYTINTSTLDTNNKLRVWNISTQNHNAHVVVNGITYVVGANTGLTAIKTPNSYSAFVGV